MSLAFSQYESRSASLMLTVERGLLTVSLFSMPCPSTDCQLFIPLLLLSFYVSLSSFPPVFTFPKPKSLAWPQLQYERTPTGLHLPA